MTLRVFFFLWVDTSSGRDISICLQLTTSSLSCMCVLCENVTVAETLLSLGFDLVDLPTCGELPAVSPLCFVTDVHSVKDR